MTVVQRITVTAPTTSSAATSTVLSYSITLALSIILIAGFVGDIQFSAFTAPPGAITLALAITLSVTIIILKGSNSSKSSYYSETVEVMPGIGVQLHSNNTGIKQFIAEEDIVDVIINEVVLSYKVTTSVCFRVRGFSDNDGDSHSIRIVLAFPSFDMKYIECERAWVGILDATGREKGAARCRR